MIADVALAAWALAYAGTAGTALARARSRPARAAVALGSCVLVRPLAGAEHDLEARLARAGGASHVVLAVGSEDDAATPIARRAVSALRACGIDASLIVTNAVGPNHKADQLARALVGTQARVIVVADSDVALDDGDLARLVAPLGRAGVVASWAPPVEQGVPSTLGDHASRSVLDASLHAFPLLGTLDERGLVGKLFAIQRDALSAIGGFESLVEVIGEDMELAARLRARGLHAVMVRSMVARSLASGRSLSDVVARYTRWLLVIRTQRPRLLLSYPLLLAPAPLLLAALAFSEGPARGLVLAALALRLVVACAARAHAGLGFAPFRALAQALLGDLTLLYALGAALCAREVRWRGRTLRVSRRKEPHEEALGQPTQAARRARVDDVELRRGDAGRERSVDARELALDPALLRTHTIDDGLLARERRAEGEPQVRLLGGAEDVAQADRHHLGSPCDPRDLRRAGPEVERRERRALASLGEDPERPTGAVEQLGGMPDGASTVGRVSEVDAKCSDAPEERQASQVRGVHHRVTVAPDQELRRIEGDQRIPPGRVVRHHEHGADGGVGLHLLEAADEHAAERALDARARVASEPGIEPAGLRPRDHQVLP